MLICKKHQMPALALQRVLCLLLSTLVDGNALFEILDILEKKDGLRELYKPLCTVWAKIEEAG